MKKIITLILCMQSLHSMQSQFNTDFSQRFGPNSPIYNAPLYFGEGRNYHLGAPAPKPSRKEYRVRLKEKKEKAKRKRVVYEKKP